MRPIGPGKQLTFSARFLASLRDASGAALATGEWIASDDAVSLFSLATVRGARDTELARFFSVSALL